MQVHLSGHSASDNIIENKKKRSRTKKGNSLPKPQLPLQELNAVSLTKDALTNEYEILSSKRDKVKMNCLIDTGATITIISYDAWNKLGKPKVEFSFAGSILLSNNNRVPITGSIDTSIIVGSDKFPIKLWLVPVWRYEVILGMDFLSEINAVINVKEKVLKVRDKCQSQCLSAYNVISKNRSMFNVVAKEDITLQPMHEARVEADIVGSFPEGSHFVIVGKDLATGVCCNDICRKLIVFLKSGTVGRDIKAGELIGYAYKINLTVIEDKLSALKDNISEVKKEVENKEIDLKQLSVGKSLNVNRLRHVFNRYKDTLDGADPNLEQLSQKFLL